jgi:hypothetical protein
LPKGYHLMNTCEREDCINCEHLKPVRYGAKKKDTDRVAMATPLERDCPRKGGILPSNG